ncbi:hypothetical protein [Lentibacter sp. XHP0401]|uniref:hypothetical protein n=1 Tax=Lentibacter sp. XHP0401 TaxID=2984334 RepID=UPI0021E950A1|nr:hypothetical protein [Lentibacter sp. XHP0401]
MAAEAMGETSATHVLRRKAKAGREEHQARVMSPARAMRLALSRSAEKLFELALSVSGVQSEQLGQDALMRSVDEDMLFIVLDGPCGAIGAVALDVPLVSGFVEKQTIGQVSAREGPLRAATATDAALVAPYVSRVLNEMSEHLGPQEGQLCEHFRFGARIESKRHLGLIIDAPDYQVLRAQIELEGGARRGEFVLCLPLSGGKAQPSEPAAAEAHPESSEQARSLMKDGALMEARAVLRAVIHRRKISLGELSELKPGVRLQFGAAALGRIELDAGSGSERLGPCKLGQQDGMRALKVQFGIRGAGKETFEPMDVADVWADLGEAETSAYSSVDVDMTPLTVDDMPDLSDLPGLGEEQQHDYLAPEREPEPEAQSLSNVG